MYFEADGTYPHTAWPGGYPLYYLMDDAETMCPDCANANRERDTGENNGWHVIDQGINWEDAEMYCANCNKRIPSAYAEDEATQ